MASQLVWKVYSGKLHVASCHYAEDAAMVVGNTAEGTVKVDGRIVWRDGQEEHPACDFIDWAADLMSRRRRANLAFQMARAQGKTPATKCPDCGRVFDLTNRQDMIALADHEHRR